jgi:hypothetical protein
MDFMQILNTGQMKDERETGGFEISKFGGV